MARHDIHGRRLQIESISHTDQSDDDVRVFAENVLRYQNSLSTKVLTGLDLVYADWVFSVMQGLEQSISTIITTSSVTIDWQEDVAPDENGNPGTLTFLESFGNTPIIQVWLEVSAGNYSLETVPVNIGFTGIDIATVTIDTGSIPARIIIK